MMMARILGANMVLLFFLRFLINKSQGEKAVDRFYRFLILNCILSRFLGGIIHAYQINGTCGYSYQSCLLRRFFTLGYCSIPTKRIRGRIE
jgi:hypothetical protein